MFKSIKSKLIVSFLAVALIPFIATAWHEYTNAQVEVSAKAAKHLTSVRESRKVILEGYLRQCRAEARFFSRSASLRSAFRQLNDARMRAGQPSSAYTEAYRRHYDDLKDFAVSLRYDELQLYDHHRNAVVFDTEFPADVEYPARQASFYRERLPEKYSPFWDARNADTVLLLDFAFVDSLSHEPVALLASPIADGDSVLGALVLPVCANGINFVMTGNNGWRQQGFGKSGECYIVADDFTMRSDSRFLIEQPTNLIASLRDRGVGADTLRKMERCATSILLQSVRSEGARAAIRGDSGTGRYKDYRGIPVIAAYTPLDIADVNWALLAEIDEEEVMGGIYELHARLKITLLLISVLIILASILIARSVSRPLRHLADGTRAIVAGDYDRRIPQGSNDEVGDLTKAFNQMAQALKQQRSDIKAQHRQLEDQKEEIHAQARSLKQTNDDLHERNRQIQDTLEKLKVAQTQLVQAEKMSTVGQLTAGIAHEINNPINFVSSNVQPLKLDFEELKHLFDKFNRLKDSSDVTAALAEAERFKDEIDADFLFKEVSELLNGIEEGARRTAEIVQGLRNFSRLDENEVKLADVNIGLDSTLVLLRNKTKHCIDLERDYGDLPKIECFPGQLNQVFMNILNNAVQAVDGSGRIKIRTRLLEDCIQVSIADNGKGMSAEVQQRIFEPFYTTKDVGEGTGLGLFISYGIVEQHNGSITVHSDEGKGSEFLISLPLSIRNSSAKSKRQSEPSSA